MAEGQPAAFVERAAALLATDPEAARRAAETLLRTAPNDPRALLILRSARRRLGDPDAGRDPASTGAVRRRRDPVRPGPGAGSGPRRRPFRPRRGAVPPAEGAPGPRRDRRPRRPRAEGSGLSEPARRLPRARGGGCA